MSFPSRYVCHAAASVAVILAGQQTQATLIVNDPILAGGAGQYNVAQRLNVQSPVPAVLGMAATGWVSGAGTSQTHPVDLSLDMPGAVYESGGKIQFDSAAVDNLYRSNARAMVTPYTAASASGPIYISGIANTDAFPATPANVGLRGYALMGFTNAVGANATSGTLAGYYLGFRATANDTMDLILRHRNGSGATLTDIVLLPNANPATNYQFILRTDVNVIGGNQETVTYWINPTDVSSEGNAGITALATGTFNDFSVQSATAGTLPADAASNISRLTVATLNWDTNSYFDEFRMGTAFADVTVPEPASMALLAAPALLALRRRRSC